MSSKLTECLICCYATGAQQKWTNVMFAHFFRASYMQTDKLKIRGRIDQKQEVFFSVCYLINMICSQSSLNKDTHCFVAVINYKQFVVNLRQQFVIIVPIDNFFLVFAVCMRKMLSGKIGQNYNSLKVLLNCSLESHYTKCRVKAGHAMTIVITVNLINGSVQINGTHTYRSLIYKLHPIVLKFYIGTYIENLSLMPLCAIE